ncbi:histidinol-phosphate transaminase [Pseudothermotoga sp.]|uniref:histidinol-phosphate transaminase n=1 Tax=Pseudothermotoga sp. TaxID=2033661 RepID=UPI0031F697DC
MSFVDIVESISENVEAYKSEKRTPVYLALNENPYPFPEGLLKEFFEKIDPATLRTYFDSPCEEFVKQIAEYVSTERWKARADQISIGNGADEIIYNLLNMFKKLHIFAFPPTYSCYEIFATALGIKLKKVPLVGERLDLKSLKKMLNQDCVVFLPNPNNPTGHLFEEEEIFFLLKTGSLVVLDEAYYEFCGKSYVSFVEEFENLIIVRTFSKAFCLASQRIGYMVASSKLIDAYDKIRLPYNVSYLSQMLASLVLSNKDIFFERVKRIVQERERLKEKLREMNFKISDSKANFVFIYLENDEKERMYRLFLENGVTVRKTELGIRIGVGSSEQNELVLKILEGFRC